MLQEFPAETVVIPVKKPTPILEGFVSEAEQQPSPRIWNDPTPAPARLKSQASAPQQPAKWLPDVGAPAMALLAPVAIVVVMLVSSLQSPGTALSPAARRGTDILLPAASVRPARELPTLAVRFETVSLPASAPKAVSRPQPVDTPRQPPPLRLKPAATRVNAPIAPVAPSHRAPPVRPEPDVIGVNAPIAPIAPIAPVAPSHRASQAPAVVPPPERLQAIAAPVNTIADEQPAIRAAINRYQAAYENLDATAAKKVWPTVNERALAKAFGDLESQTLTFEPCQIDVRGTRARASCPGYARYVGRVGKTRNEQRRDWTFVLQKSNESWLIDAVQSR